MPGLRSGYAENAALRSGYLSRSRWAELRQESVGGTHALSGHRPQITEGVNQ